MKSTGQNNLELTALFAAAVLVFLAQLGSRDIVTAHEGRVAQSARVMAASGWPWRATPTRVIGYVESNEAKSLVPKHLPDDRDRVNAWVYPVIDDEIRLQKPPLPYWTAAVLFRSFGTSQFVARLAPALLGALAALLVWDLARLILGRRAALPAALVWITTRFIVDEMRHAVADPYLAFFVLLTFWGWWRCGRGRNILAWIALAFGTLAKGPVIFIFIIPAMILAKLFLRRRSGGPRWIAHFIGAILFCAIALPWPLYVLHHAPDVWRIWWYESGGEISGLNVEKARSWWTYLATSFQLALPWTPIWIAGIVVTIARIARRGLRAPRNRRRAFALLWYLITVIFFSCLSVKKDAYLLPVMAAQTLIVADALVMIRATVRRAVKNGREMSVVLMAMQIAIGVGFAIGLPFAMRRLHQSAWVYLLCGGALALSIVAARATSRLRWKCWLIAQCGAYVMLLMAMLGFYLAAVDNRRSPRVFASALSDYLAKSDLPLLVTQLPEEASFYLPLNLPVDPSASRVLVVIDHSPNDPPVDAQLLCDLMHGATIRAFRRVVLITDNSRYQLYDVIVDRNRA